MMPESLFEPYQANESNTVAFGAFGNSEFIFSDLGIPHEFALIFDDTISTTKTFNPAYNPEYTLPMNQNQFYPELTDSIKQYKPCVFPTYPLNSCIETNFIPDLQQDFSQSLRALNTSHRFANQKLSFSAPDLDSVFSESVSNTPHIQLHNTLNNKPFELFADPFISQSTQKPQENELKKISPSLISKKYKRKHVMARSRTGCWICRIKHLKCDELRPNCHNCTRFGIECDFSVDRPAYVLDINLRKEKLDAITTKKRRRTSD